MNAPDPQTWPPPPLAIETDSELDALIRAELARERKRGPNVYSETIVAIRQRTGQSKREAFGLLEDFYRRNGVHSPFKVAKVGFWLFVTWYLAMLSVTNVSELMVRICSRRTPHPTVYQDLLHGPKGFKTIDCVVYGIFFIVFITFGKHLARRYKDPFILDSSGLSK